MSDAADNPSDDIAADFRLGKVLARPSRLVLEYDGACERIEPRVMDILVLLAAHDGETVTRETLRAELWDAHVTDDAIQRAVWKLRRALGPHAHLIETIPKRGYRATSAALPAEIAGEPPAAAFGATRAGATVATAKSRQPTTMPEPAAGVDESCRRRTAIPRLVTAALAVAAAGLLWALAPSLDTADSAAVSIASPATAVDFAPFTSLSGYESHPSVDGPHQAVVFANFAKEGPDAFQWDLWRQSLDGGPAQRLTATPAHEMNPAVSPSGRGIAFVRLQGEACDVLVLDTSSRTETPVEGGCGASRGPTDCCTELAWRDDQRLLVSRRDDADGPKRLYEVDLGTSAQRLLTDPPAQWYGDTAMAVAGDGRVAIVRRRAPEIADLYLLEPSSGTLERLTADGYPISGVTWAEGDGAIIFSRDRTGTAGLWSIDPSGGAPAPVASIGMNASGPAAGGGALLYEEWKSEINVWELDIVGGDARPRITSTRWDWRAQPSPDGARLAFVSNRSGAAELWLSAPDGSGARPLTDLGSGVASMPAWSPGGSRIALAAPHDGSIDIALVGADDGAVEWIVTDASDDREPVFSGDGRHLFFSSNRGGEWDIWRLDTRSGEIVRWTTEGGVAPRPGFADNSVWHVRPDRPGLWRKVGVDQPAVLIDPGFEPAAVGDWMPGPDGIYYLRYDAAQVGWLTRFDPDNGVHHDLLRLADERGVQELFGNGGLWISPDGGRALLSSVDRSHSDLWIGFAGQR